MIAELFLFTIILPELVALVVCIKLAVLFNVKLPELTVSAPFNVTSMPESTETTALLVTVMVQTLKSLEIV